MIEFFPASWYYNIYLFITSILTIGLSIEYASFSDYRIASGQPRTSMALGIIIAVVMTLFIGMRPLSKLFVDMVNYNTNYYALFYGNEYEFTFDTDNVIFDNILHCMAAEMIDIRFFFLLIAAIYFGCSYLGCAKMFPKDALYAYTAFLAAFSTFSYATNGIKAGAAASIFICAIAYRKNLLIALPLLAISWGFHHSMVLPIGAFFVCEIFKNPKYYLLFWGLAFIMAFAHVEFFQEIFAGFSDDKGAEYLLNDKSDFNGKIGFRLDFIFYSAIPIAFGYYAIFVKKLESKGFNFIFNMYVFLNAIWMLCMYAAFTNRIAYLSWFLYPIVLVYPFFTKPFIPRQFRVLNFAVWFQLLFTLGMHFIYYA